MDEKTIYEERKYWRRYKVMLTIILLAGLFGLGGLLAVLYAFHLDPDTVVTVTEISHDCGHCPDSHPVASTSYASHEIAWSGIFYLVFLCIAGFFSAVVTDR